MSVQLFFSPKINQITCTFLPSYLYQCGAIVVTIFSPFLLGSLLKSLLQKSLIKKVRRPKNKGFDLESI